MIKILLRPKIEELVDSRDLATEEKDTDLADKEMPKKVNDKKQNRYPSQTLLS